MAGEVNKGRDAICGQVTDEQGNLGSVAVSAAADSIPVEVMANAVTADSTAAQAA